MARSTNQCSSTQPCPSGILENLESRTLLVLFQGKSGVNRKFFSQRSDVKRKRFVLGKWNYCCGKETAPNTYFYPF